MRIYKEEGVYNAGITKDEGLKWRGLYNKYFKVAASIYHLRITKEEGLMVGVYI